MADLRPMGAQSKAGAVSRAKKLAKKVAPAKKAPKKDVKKPAEVAAQLSARLAATEDDASLDQELRDMVMGALRRAGGEDYLFEAATNPRTKITFLTLLGKYVQREDPSAGRWSGTVNIYSGVNRGPKSA